MVVVAYISLRNLKHSRAASITVVIVLSHCTNGLRPQSFHRCGRRTRNHRKGPREVRRLASSITFYRLV